MQRNAPWLRANISSLVYPCPDNIVGLPSKIRRILTLSSTMATTAEDMLQCAGFNIESEVRYSFIPNGPGHKYPEVRYLLLARKVEDQPLLGPYPSPTKDELLSMHIRHHPVDRFISFELDAFLEVVTKEILCLGCINKGISQSVS